jgi:hypothetical protein
LQEENEHPSVANGINSETDDLIREEAGRGSEEKSEFVSSLL